MNKMWNGFYAMVRMISGALLIIQGYWNTIYFDRFLLDIDNYFQKARFFDFFILRILTPFIPFAEFAIGLFIMAGFLTKRTLMAGLIIFIYMTLFLMDSNAYEQVSFHASIAIVFILLILYTDYNKYSLDRMNLTFYKWF